MPIVGVFGGSFNPPHLGHMLVAGWALWSGTVDRVVLLPTYRHAFDKPLAPWPLRVASCRALAEQMGPAVEVSAIEATLPVPSYTITSLNALAADRPRDRLRLLVGADVLPTVGSWRQWPEIVDRFTPVVVGRVGHPVPPDAIVFPDVSSTDIRERLRAGLSVDHLVPSSVRGLMGGEWTS